MIKRLLLALACAWPQLASAEAVAEAAPTASLLVIKFSHTPEFVGLPKFCESEGNEIIICDVSLIQGKVMSQRTLAGPAIPKRFLLRLIKAHDHLRLRKGSQILVSARPFEDADDKGYFAERWWPQDKLEKYCLEPQAVAELKAESLFAKARTIEREEGRAERCAKL